MEGWERKEEENEERVVVQSIKRVVDRAAARQALHLRECQLR
jgi:hypothetical protein